MAPWENPAEGMGGANLKILVVEDDPALAGSLCRGLREERYVVEHAKDGEEALWAAKGGGFDLVILDLLLPRVPGIEVCRRLRREGSRVPVLMLTALDATDEVVAGLDAGANDYMSKPFSLAELLARVRAATRSGAPAAAVIEIGDLAVDRAARAVRIGGAPLELTTKEFQLIEILALHAGSALSRARIGAALWEHDEEPDSNALEVYVGTLRRALGTGPRRPSIHTMRGFGYVLRGPGA
jgi:DNA-binding response OmpR family regulator